jgi:hypothetical protein
MTTEPTTGTPAPSSASGWRVRSSLKDAWQRLSRAQKALASLALVLLLVPAVGTAALLAVKGVKNWEALGRGALSMGLTILVTLGIFYVIFQRKHRAAAWTAVVFLLSCGTCFSGVFTALFISNYHDTHRRADARRFAVTLQQVADVQERRLQSRVNDPEVAAANMRNMESAVEAFASNQSPSVQAALRIVMQHTKRQAAMKVEYRRAFQDLKNAGGLSAHTMTDSGAVSARLQLLEEAARHLEEIRKAQRTFFDDLRQQMIQANIPRQEIDAILQGLSIDEQTSLQFLTFDLEAQALQHAERYIRVLQQHDGRWRVNQNAQLEFLEGVPESDVQACNDAYQLLTSVAEEQRVVNERMVQLTRERAERLSR